MEKKGMSLESAFFMLLAAAMVDAVQFILDWFFIGLLFDPFIDGVAWIGFKIWFDHAGIDSAGMTTAGVLELIPGIDGLPVWTGYIALAIFWNYGKKTVQGLEEAGLASRRPRNQR